MAIRSLAASTRRDVVAALATLDRFEAADSRKLTGRVLREMIGPSFGPHAALPTMQAVAASETAMQAVAASETAMQVVAASATARSAVLNSPTAMSIVGASSMAIGKLVAGIAGLSPADYADMQAVADSATAMQAVAASATAMQAVVASVTALAAICQSSTAAVAVKSAIQSYRSTIISTLDNGVSAGQFKKSTITVLDANKASTTMSHGIGTNTFYIPKAATGGCGVAIIWEAYYGADTSYRFATYEPGTGNSDVPLTDGVSLRGIKVSKSAGNCASYERFICDVYTVV